MYIITLIIRNTNFMKVSIKQRVAANVDKIKEVKRGQ